MPFVPQQKQLALASVPSAEQASSLPLSRLNRIGVPPGQTPSSGNPSQLKSTFSNPLFGDPEHDELAEPPPRQDTIKPFTGSRKEGGTQQIFGTIKAPTSCYVVGPPEVDLAQFKEYQHVG